MIHFRSLVTMTGLAVSQHSCQIGRESWAHYDPFRSVYPIRTSTFKTRNESKVTIISTAVVVISDGDLRL
jgi:hypothetical protein